MKASCIRTQLRPLIAAASVGMALWASAPTGNAQTLAWREQEAIGWACGGIGLEERQALKILEAKANAVMLFVAGGRGTLVADVRLRVVSAGDATRGLEIVADGPVCVLQLPAGSWNIEARHGETVRARTAILKPQDTGNPQRLQFAFPEESNGSPRASQEESSGVSDWGRVGR
ncbi:MAG: hypothetical protein KGR68_11340 [Betaproteobacteria bacterium]|nr:hypothetical protein [Betaproteobacteria bacterium]